MATGWKSSTWKQPLTLERLKSCLEYDQLTGEFRHISARKGRGKLGQEAGSRSTGGYVQIRLDGIPYSGHHLAWFYVTGEWVKQIDHIDRDPSNNRISNLRPCTTAQNCANKRAYSTNTSGFKGVTRCKATGRWVAQITANYRKIHIGRFDTPEEAHTAYVSKAKELHGAFRRLV